MRAAAMRRARQVWQQKHEFSIVLCITVLCNYTQYVCRYASNACVFIIDCRRCLFCSSVSLTTLMLTRWHRLSGVCLDAIIAHRVMKQTLKSILMY